jgi:TRAP-type mannitol/chloroaromatic compound transport system permease small subunit
MRNTVTRIAETIDRMNAAIGRAAAWCALYLVLAEFAVVVLRYAFGLGSIRLQESVLYAHAVLFMLAAAWTLQVDGHVRVDIFYSQATARRRAVIDLLGAILFLMPFATMLAVLSVPYAARSWAIFEGSPETGGLPLVYLLKTLIPLFALLLGLQGIAQAIRAALVLTGPRGALPSSPARSPAVGGG